jgi:pimeloyl-ACP methyl ester carboxylesterase
MLSTPIPYGRASRAQWADEPSGTVIVFVHGFNGHATETWTEFDRLLAGSNHDLVFYGYDSLRGRTNPMALRLLECLEDLMEKPALFVNSTVDPADARACEFKFKRLVVVAHSLGAVVARRALLHARTKPWLTDTDLCLYAPAHKGAHLLALVSSVMSLFQAPIGAIAKWRFPVLADLEEKSDALDALARDTDDAIGAGLHGVRAKLIVLSEEDDVVNTNPMSSHEHRGVPLPYSHGDVCKPNDDRAEPLQRLQDVLRPPLGAR